MAIGHYVSRALDLAARLGIADLLAAGARPAAALAAETRTDAAALRRVLRLLASVGVFEEREDGTFGLTELGSLLRSDVSGSARAQVQLFAGIGIQDSWRELEYCVRTGQPAFRQHSPGADAFSAMGDEAARIFDAAMATFAPATSAAMAEAYDYHGDRDRDGRGGRQRRHPGWLVARGAGSPRDRLRARERGRARP
jgi:hypothetical protein